MTQAQPAPPQEPPTPTTQQLDVTFLNALSEGQIIAGEVRRGVPLTLPQAERLAKVLDLFSTDLPRYARLAGVSTSNAPAGIAAVKKFIRQSGFGPNQVVFSSGEVPQEAPPQGPPTGPVTERPAVMPQEIQRAVEESLAFVDAIKAGSLLTLEGAKQLAQDVEVLEQTHPLSAGSTTQIDQFIAQARAVIRASGFGPDQVPFNAPAQSSQIQRQAGAPIRSLRPGLVKPPTQPATAPAPTTAGVTSKPPTTPITGGGQPPTTPITGGGPTPQQGQTPSLAGPLVQSAGILARPLAGPLVQSLSFPSGAASTTAGTVINPTTGEVLGIVNPATHQLIPVSSEAASIIEQTNGVPNFTFGDTGQVNGVVNPATGAVAPVGQPTSVVGSLAAGQPLTAGQWVQGAGSILGIASGAFQIAQGNEAIGSLQVAGNIAALVTPPPFNVIIAIVSNLLPLFGGLFGGPSKAWITFPKRLKDTLTLEQDATRIMVGDWKNAKGVQDVERSIDQWKASLRTRIGGFGQGMMSMADFLASPDARAVVDKFIPGLPGATGTPHEGKLQANFDGTTQALRESVVRMHDHIRPKLAPLVDQVNRADPPAQGQRPYDAGDLYLAVPLIMDRAQSPESVTDQEVLSQIRHVRDARSRAPVPDTPSPSPALFGDDLITASFQDLKDIQSSLKSGGAPTREMAETMLKSFNLFELDPERVARLSGSTVEDVQRVIAENRSGIRASGLVTDPTLFGNPELESVR